MKIKLNYNKKASETVERLKKVGIEKFGIQWVKFDTDKEINYGISNFNLPKDEQARFFEEIIDNTIISTANYNIIDDYRLVVMKNPTRVMLWKDAKHIQGTKYLFAEEKHEWRINYSFGKVNAVINKNVNNRMFGKADITTWSPETRPEIRKYLIKVTKDIAEKLKNAGYNVQSFGIDIIHDKLSNQYYFLELNQANSLNETGCELFLKSYLESIKKRFPHIDEFFGLLNPEEVDYLTNLCIGVDDDDDGEDDE